jgi:hypothetical protein
VYVVFAVFVRRRKERPEVCVEGRRKHSLLSKEKRC